MMEPQVLAPAEAKRFLRVGQSLIVVGVILIASLPIRSRNFVVKASSHKPDHGSERAVDSRPMTYWAPRGLNGRLEYKFQSQRFIKRVGLLSARNRYQKAFAARRYVVELYSGPELVTQVTGDFDVRVDEPPWIWREVDSTEIDKIIVRVEGATGHPAGLAEFRFE